ncbi:hypothetical protein [Staphylococcus intermedius]|nr:hypothetical protein [Staphylococcus intermedius]
MDGKLYWINVLKDVVWGISQLEVIQMTSKQKNSKQIKINEKQAAEDILIKVKKILNKD